MPAGMSVTSGGDEDHRQQRVPQHTQGVAPEDNKVWDEYLYWRSMEEQLQAAAQAGRQQAEWNADNDFERALRICSFTAEFYRQKLQEASLAVAGNARTGKGPSS